MPCKTVYTTEMGAAALSQKIYQNQVTLLFHNQIYICKEGMQ